jgi:uncharacterized protein (DUF1501 family)
MHLIDPAGQSRRAFMRRTSQLAFTGAALPTALSLAAMGEAAAFNASDYKALVCVFLYGGNDHANSVIAYDDPSYNAYAAVRGGGPGQSAGGIAIAKADLAATLLKPTPQLPDGRVFAFHPSMPGLAGLFNAGKAAVVLNAGPLVVPMTKAQYLSGNRTLNPLPPKLFSHNDQQSVWQSSSPEGSTVGWGGNIGDLAMSANTNSLFTCMSITGNSVFLSGDQALPYQVSSSGPVPIYSMRPNAYPFGFLEVGNSMQRLGTQLGRAHVLENEYNRVTARALSAEAGITTAVASSAPTNNVFPAPFNLFPAGNPLADQMRMVARLIAARTALGTKRQVFMVSIGGFDLHDELISKQPNLMRRVSEAMTAFSGAMDALGVGDKVTAFTASDFGRTLSSNGDGSDHGWGSHYWVVGGAVRGKAFYGYAPPMGAGNTSAPIDQWHVGQGRLLPTTSVDQYAATLARWFGVENSELNGILPNLSNFGGSLSSATGTINYPRTLGFMG